MLVLSRKKNESIVIDNNITVTVVEIRGDKVRLGIVLPKDVPVHRQEVYDAIHGLMPAEDVRLAPAGWGSSTDPAAMLRLLRDEGAVTGRMARLFAAACCRRQWGLL